VARVSNNRQIPAIYSQFFGTAFLGEVPLDFEGNKNITRRPLIIGTYKEPEPAKFWSVGASVGSSFAAPWAIGTLSGTIAPIRNSFLQIGFDFGLISGTADAGYYSLYPFAHYAYYMPFDMFGVYAGLGGGLLMVSYSFDNEGDYSNNIPVASVTAGIFIFDMIHISYALRTNFSGYSHKVSVGYTYRFE